MNLYFFSLLIWILFTPLSTYAQEIPDSLKIKVDAIFQEYNNYKSPGCAIAIISNGNAIFKKCYGMASMEHDIPISTTTVFDIASLAKQFTGFAISTLIQEGKISVHDDIRKYLPFVPDFGKTITISHLLHHSSGLRDWPKTLAIAGWKEDDVLSFDDIIRFVQHQKELDFEPGTHFSYSNTGYNLLAAIIEKVSGKTFPQWVHENVFTRLKMDASIIPEIHTTFINNLAGSYLWSQNEYIKCTNQLTAFGSSSVFTSLNDMINWSIYFDEQVQQNNPVFIRMLETGKLDNGDTIYYGFGLGLNKNGEEKRIAHSGWWSGFRSIIVNYPDKHLYIIILSNSGSFIPRPFAEEIADVMLERKVDQKITTIDSRNEKNVIVEKSLAEKYAGCYQLGTDWYITITMENNQLMSRTNGEIPYPMTAKSDSTYWVDAYNNAIKFVKDSSGYILKYKSIMAKRIVPFTPDTILINQYTGKYYSEELLTEYILTVKDGKLWVFHFRLGDFEMYPDPLEDTFGCHIGAIKFIRDEKMEIIGFHISGSRIRNIHFIKQ